MNEKPLSQILFEAGIAGVLAHEPKRPNRERQFWLNWEELPEDRKAGWEAVAQAAIQHIKDAILASKGGVS